MLSKRTFFVIFMLILQCIFKIKCFIQNFDTYRSKASDSNSEYSAASNYFDPIVFFYRIWDAPTERLVTAETTEIR